MDNLATAWILVGLNLYLFAVITQQERHLNLKMRLCDVAFQLQLIVTQPMHS